MNKSIDEVFSRLYQDTVNMLNENGMGNNMFELTGESRRITNYISDQIRKGNIEENC